VAWKHDCLIGQRHDLGADPLQQQLAIATRQIPTANTTSEKHIATYQQTFLRQMKT